MTSFSKRTLVCVLSLSLVFSLLLCACGANKSALHIHYKDTAADTVESNYSKGDYLYNAVTFTGSALGQEQILSVQELETMVSQEPDLAYEGTYSLLTRGSVFSTHTMTGLKLYDLLLTLGLDEGAPDDTAVFVRSSDGYTNTLTVGDLKSDQYGCYESLEATEPETAGMPVLLSFGSDGVPLVGAVGSQSVGTQISAEEGYNETADNVGGPVRLTIGQTAANDFNAPSNGKWVTKVIVGEDASYAYHTNSDAQQTALTVSVTEPDATVSETSYTYGDIEAASAEDAALVEGYYGTEGYYKGLDLWSFLVNTVGISSASGTVTFHCADGSQIAVPLDYIRNLGGDYDGYTTTRDDGTITAQKPAIGFSRDGAPSAEGVYALLPAAESAVAESTAALCTSITVELDEASLLEANPNGDAVLAVAGDGVKTPSSHTVNELEAALNLQASQNGYSGFSLLALLKQSGLTVDADTVTLYNGEQQTASFSMDELDASTVLATRQNLQALDAAPIALVSEDSLLPVTRIEVGIRDGQWTHDADPYLQYQSTTLTVRGSEVQETTYTLAQLEALDAVRDSFGASGGTNGYQGVDLKALIETSLRSGIAQPSKITVVGQDGYQTELSVDTVWNGIASQYQKGQTRPVLLAYSIDGIPLVPDTESDGYNGSNAYGPIRLVVENSMSGWVKNVREVIVGE